MKKLVIKKIKVKILNYYKMDLIYTVMKIIQKKKNLILKKYFF